MTEIEVHFLDQIEVCKRLVKSICLIFSTVIAGGFLLLCWWYSGSGLPVRIALNRISPLFCSFSSNYTKFLKNIYCKARKYVAIKLLPRNKVDSIEDII